MTGDGVPSVWSWIDKVGPLSTVSYVIRSREWFWVELVTCGACHTSIHQKPVC